MRDPGPFDAFYKTARERLFVQTYALTGDRTAAQSATRDAFIITWHHWRKVARLEDPEMYVRPLAWRLALRHHTGRVWHREKDVDPQVRATREALGRLTLRQRQLLLLSQFAIVSFADMAREVGITQDVAERELQTAVASFSLARSIEASAIRRALGELATEMTGTAKWPRATIVRRAGAARRRSHTAIGAAAAVAAVAVSGLLVGDGAGVRPTLDRGVVASPPPTSTPPPAAPSVDEGELLTADEVAEHVHALGWIVEGTGTELGEVVNGLPCGLDDFTVAAGDHALARSLRARAARPKNRHSLAHLIEASPREKRAQRRYERAAGLLAGCTDPGTYLDSTRSPSRVGDQSIQFVLRSGGRRSDTHTVGLARTGVYVTLVLLTQHEAEKAANRAMGDLLAEAVSRLCTFPGGGACAPAEPTILVRDPLRAGTAPSMLSEFDLPPVPGVDEPWIGTPPMRATENPAASSCDNTAFTGTFGKATWSRARTRTFVIPEGNLPRAFGLSQTVGALPEAQARKLVARVRARLASCHDRELSAEVKQIKRIDRGDRSLTAWRLDIAVSDQRTITFWMAIVRNGTGIAQLGFLPAKGASLSGGDFVDLAERAVGRLGELGAPRTR